MEGKEIRKREIEDAEEIHVESRSQRRVEFKRWKAGWKV